MSNPRWTPFAIAGGTGGLVGLMTFASRWVLSATRQSLEPIDGSKVIAAAIYDAATEIVVLFGLVAAILVTVQVYMAYLWWERFHVGGELAPTPPTDTTAPTPPEG